QPLRTRLLAERGLLKVVEEAGLTPARLAQAMDEALAAPGFPAPARLDLDGLTRSVEIVERLVDGVAAARRAAGRPQVARRR
ncbi:MAG: glycosyl transferase family 28, partial [candidate division NC10 bacterium]|nr:glycosyl transferase family 28 [candidate division NC10 bacterium]